MGIITKLNKENFEEILKNYHLGKYKYHKHLDWAHTNTIYQIKTTKGNYILKIFENAEFKFVKFQNEIIKFLKKLIPTPKNILTIKSKFYLKYENKIITIQKEIKGIRPKRITREILEESAYYLGKIDRKLNKIKVKEYDSWGEHIFSKTEFQKIPEIDIKGEYLSILEQLKKLDFKKFKRGYIHGDFHESNILVKNNKITAILDWDDCHKDYYIYELTIFIASLLFNKKGLRKNILKEVIKEYEKSINLSKQEKEALYYLIKQRLLSLINYSKKHGDDKSKWFYKKVRDYQNFNNLSFKNFQKMI